MPIGAEAQVQQSAGARDLDVAVADDGSYVVVTMAVSPAKNPPFWGPSTVWLTRYTAAGVQVGQPVVVGNDTAATRPDVEADIDADGDAVVAFRSSTSGVVQVVRVSTARVVSAPVNADVPLTGGGIVTDVTVSMDAGGGFFVGWINSPAEGFNQIRARAFDAAGAPRGAACTADTGSIATGYGNMQIAAYRDGSGAVYTVTGGGGERPTAVNAGRLGVTAAVADPFGLGITPGEDRDATLAVHADKSFVVAYDLGVGGPIGGDHADFAVYAQRFAADGTPVGDAILLGESLPGEGTKQHTYGVGIDTMPDGGFLVGFQQQIGEVYTAYAQLITGTAGNDTIRVHLDGANLIATRGATTRTYRAAQVQLISINGFAGNETITTDTLLPSTMSGGGSGNDWIYAQDNAVDRIFGEGGDDAAAADEDDVVDEHVEDLL